MNIKTFTGKPTEWPTFIETFEAAIDSNATISDIQKFQYLKGYLSGQAEKCIDNLTLTNDNYSEALKLLKERFGNTQLIINAHVSQLMKTSVVEEGNAPRLCNFLDTVESHVRALSNQEVNKEHFGAMLIPVIQDRLPYNIRVELNCKMGKDNWKLDDYLESLRIEVEARNNSELPGDTIRKPPREEPLTLQTLMSALEEKFEKKKNIPTISRESKNNRKIICIFCNDGHYSDKCSKNKKFDDRIEILKTKKCCFKCMKSGHSKFNCKNRVKCFKCNSFSHHTALCRNEEKTNTDDDKKRLTPNQDDNQDPQHNFLVHHNQTVLLQTAKGVITNVDETKAKSVRILLDSCSQSSYISEKAVKALSLKEIGGGNISINTLGNKDEKYIYEYEFKIKTLKNNFSLLMKALCVPKISDSMNGRYIGIVITQNSFLKELDLADDGIGSGETDILIGADLYWFFVDGNVKKNDRSGLAALSSKFGWLVSGPVPRINPNGGFNSNTMITTHVLFSQSFSKAETNLNEEIKKFWDLDSVGIRDDEISIYDKHSDGIELKTVVMRWDYL